MPDGRLATLSERIRKVFGRAIRRIRTALGLPVGVPPPVPPIPPAVYRVYMYEVRASGHVIPPKEVQKKRRYRRETVIRFELSFEERPYFRTFISNLVDAKKRYESGLEDLVKEQEIRAIKESAFTYPVSVSAEVVSEKTLRAFLKTAKPEERKEYERTGKIKVIGRATFVIDTIDFEPVGFFDIPRERLKVFEARDRFIFKLYRPLEDIEYISWEDEYLHGLR